MRSLAAAFTAAFLLAVFLPTRQVTAAETTCADLHMSIGHEIHDWLVHQPDIVVRKYIGADAEAGIAIYNSLPPPGADTGDTFYIAFNPHSPQAYMAITRGDCIVSNGMWPVPVAIEVDRAIAKARGQQS